VSSALRGAAFAAAGGGIAVVALIFIAISGMYALATIVAPWIAALIIAGIAAVIGGALIMAGVKKMHSVSFAMPKTVATIKEDIQWAKPSTR
jgi:hypothetical protein